MSQSKKIHPSLKGHHHHNSNANSSKNTKEKSLTKPQLFEEDVVYKPTRSSKRIGIISKVGWESDDEDDSEDEDEKLAEEKVRVSWYIDGDFHDEVDETPHSLSVLDRSFLHGDIVCWKDDVDTQTGTVADVQVFLDLKLTFNPLLHQQELSSSLSSSTTTTRDGGRILKNVPSYLVDAIHPFQEGAYVVFNNSFGTIEECREKVEIQFADGRRCLVDAENVDDYYLDMSLKCPNSLLKDAEWVGESSSRVDGAKKKANNTGVIVNVIPGQVVVQPIIEKPAWLFSSSSSPSASSSSSASPPTAQSGNTNQFEEEGDRLVVCSPKDLQVINTFNYTDWQVGDRLLADVQKIENLSSFVAPEREDIPPASPNGKNKAQNAIPSPYPLITPPTLKQSLLTKSLSSNSNKSNHQNNRNNNQNKKNNKTQPIDTAHPGGERDQRKRNKFQLGGVVVCTHTFVDVVWQDCSRSVGIPSTELLPVTGILSNDFWPEDFVYRKLDPLSTNLNHENIHKDQPQENQSQKVDSKENINPEDPTNELNKNISQNSAGSGSSVAVDTSKVGIVKKLDHEARICTVKWLSPDTLQPIKKLRSSSVQNTNLNSVSHSANQMTCTNKKKKKKKKTIITETTHQEESEQIEEKEEDLIEEIAVYDLVNHPFYDYRIGNLVAKIDALHQPERSLKKETETDKENDKDKEKGNEKEKEIDGRSEAWIGEILGIHDGQIRVLWSDQSISFIGPHQIYHLDPDDDFGSFDEEADDDDEQNENGDDEWETIEEIEIGAEGDEYYEDEEAENLEGQEEQEEQEKQDKQEKQELEPEEPEPEPEQEATENDKTSEANYNARERERQDIDEKDSAACSITCSHLSTFSRFEILDDASDHKFYDSIERGTGKPFAHRLHSEWNILTKSLPEGIFLQAYESRIDLLRFLILGPAGTPYWNGVFIFDLQVKSDYPSSPPILHFRSVLSERLNPNLYENGRVCLSLLGTWSGKDCEVWNPTSSNILQVILSIQGLILGTREPYYLEAGYEKYRGTVSGYQNSRLYNEMAFLLCLQSMIAQIKNPPTHFSSLIYHHFHHSGPTILNSCRTFLSSSSSSSLKSQEITDKSSCTEKTKRRKKGSSQQDDQKQSEEELVQKQEEEVVLKPSKGFLQTLEKIFPDLQEAIASCSNKIPKD